MIELNQLQLVQLSAPELISSEPTTDDGKTVLLKWTPVRNAVSYKINLDTINNETGAKTSRILRSKQLTHRIPIKQFFTYSGFVAAVDQNNQSGLGSVAFKFYGPRVPNAPSRLIAKFEPNKNMISCAWDAVTIQGATYNLYYTISTPVPPNDDNWSKVEEIETSSFILGGATNDRLQLLPNKLYTIKVSVVSQFGLESTTSTMVQVNTRDPPPMAPTNLTMSINERDQVVMRWTQTGQQWRHFVVTIECEKCDESKKEFETTTPTIVLPKLEPGVTYRATVLAVSKRTAQLGRISESLVFQSPDRRPLPAAVDIRAKSTLSEIMVSWKWDGDRTKLAHFRLILDIGDMNEHFETAEVKSNERTHTFESLERDTDYVINLYAVGENGVETQSPPHHIATKMVFNSTVENVTVMPGPSGAMVKWRSPKEVEKRDIQIFEVRYRKQGSGEYQTQTVEKNRKMYGVPENDYQLDLNLESDTVYTIQVAAKIRNLPMEWSKPIEIKTGLRGSPTLVELVITENEALIEWTPPQTKPAGYQLNILDSTNKDDRTEFMNATTTKFRVKGLQWGRKYKFTLFPLDRSNKKGPPISEIRQVPIRSPLAPPELSIRSSNSRVVLTWRKLSSRDKGGEIRSYNIRWRMMKTDRRQIPPEKWSVNEHQQKSVAEATSNLTLPLSKRAFCGEKWEFAIAAYNEAGLGPFSTPKEGFCGMIRKIENVRVLEVAKSWIHLEWDMPTLSIINNLRIDITVNGRPRSPITLISTANSYKLSQLPSHANVTAQLIARTNTYEIKSDVIQVYTNYAPTIGRVIVDESFDINGTAHLTLPSVRLSPEDPKPEHVSLVVAASDQIPDLYRQVDLEQLTISVDEETNQPRPWIAAKWRYPSSYSSGFFLLGDGRQIYQYINSALKPGADYYFFLRLEYDGPSPYNHTSSRLSEPIMMSGYLAQSAGFNDPIQTIIVSSVLGAVALVALFIIVMRRKVKGGKEKDFSSGIRRADEIRADEKPLLPDIAQQCSVGKHSQVAQLTQRLEKLKANGGMELNVEWTQIESASTAKHSQTAQIANRSKCRYGDLICPDPTRVELSSGVFIHANWVTMYGDQKAIATQGPMTETIVDFWQMIWENNVEFLVMLCELEERGRQKCNQYWPDSETGPVEHGPYQIKSLEENHLAHWSVLKLSIEYNGITKTVHHLKFHAWPDCGVPEFPAPFLAFLERIPKALQTPLVVHCSAGLGRTGTFLLTWSLLKQHEKEGSFDSSKQLVEMRAARPGLVQSEEQYLFVLEAIAEALHSCSGEAPSLMAAKEIPERVAKLSHPVGNGGLTGFDVEFKRLENIFPTRSRAQAANLTCNKQKNRMVNILPYDSSRVYLRPIRGVEGSDYINASFIDGYKERSSYIATQAPLDNTTDDFWRMIWEYNVTMIVMLTKNQEKGRQMCHQYWPEEKKTRFTYFIVEPTTQFKCDGYVIREFLMTDARDGSSRTIRQFHFTAWPEETEVPRQADYFIDLIGQVHKTRESFGVAGPICVHCSGGVGRTGVFLALTIILERLRCEGEIDIFQVVKLMRCRRPTMIQTVEQYQFIYKVTMDYLQNF